MMNWIEGNWPDGFKCIVNHDGMFDQRDACTTPPKSCGSPSGRTAAPQYENPTELRAVQPGRLREKWQTPMLVVHGEQDFRIPYSQGIAAFTALQRHGIESRLLMFPDENHWVLKPANSVLWYHTVLGWLDEHLKH